MPRVSVNLLTIVDRRVLNGIMSDINGKKEIPVVDNYMSPKKRIGRVIPGSAVINGDMLMCQVEIDELVDLEPVYIKRPAQLLALEQACTSMGVHTAGPIECVSIENRRIKASGKKQRSRRAGAADR